MAGGFPVLGGRAGGQAAFRKTVAAGKTVRVDGGAACMSDGVQAEEAQRLLQPHTLKSP